MYVYTTPICIYVHGCVCDFYFQRAHRTHICARMHDSCLSRLSNHTKNVSVRELERVLEARAADIDNLSADVSSLGVAGCGVGVSSNVFDEIEQMILKLLHIALRDGVVVMVGSVCTSSSTHTHTHTRIRSRLDDESSASG